MAGGFSLSGDAGSVADILLQAQVYQRFKVIRDFKDVMIEDILVSGDSDILHFVNNGACDS